MRRILAAANPLKVLQHALLSRAKHRSLAGHPRIASYLARHVPQYTYNQAQIFGLDGAPTAIQDARAAGLAGLEAKLQARSPKTLAASRALSGGLSDMQLVARYRVPFQFRELATSRLGVGGIVESADGVIVRDLDGYAVYDLGGSYGVNLFGNAVYKRCLAQAVEDARDLGLVLGAYHPITIDNVDRLRSLSGMDEISFHMSGTEAVMQAVRLARYHTGRRRVVRFAGAYHGWWDGVQSGPGNPMPATDVFTLAELSETTIEVLSTRNDIACVLVNPIQALHPNTPPAADSTLIAGVRGAHFDKERYIRWLQRLRAVCTSRGIALIFDEVFLGFRLAKRGAQAFFGVQADLVLYGKTVGGGLPVGVLCGKRAWMQRFREDRPADVCLARGTFSAHPYVMTAMNAILRYLDTPAAEATWEDLEPRWNGRAVQWNEALAAAGVPVRVANLASVFTTTFTQPGRFHWLLQYYLRAEGVSLGWVGTGRLVFSHDYTDDDVTDVIRRFVIAATAMQADGWFWRSSAMTARSIHTSVAREMLRHLVRRRRTTVAPTPRAGANTSEPASAAP